MAAVRGLFSRFIPDRAYLPTKLLRARDGLWLELKLQAVLDRHVIGRASKRIRFKTLAVQPFPDAAHDRGQFLALAAQLNYVQHTACLTPPDLAFS